MLSALTRIFGEYTYSYTTTTSSGGGAGMAAGVLIALLLICLIIYLVGGYMQGRVFQKAGKPMWAGFVPFYNTWLMLEMGGKSGAHVFWVFLPYVGSIIFLVMYVMAMLEVGRRFGKSTAFSVFGLIIFSIVGLIILAFDDSTYKAPAVAAAAPAGPAPASFANPEAPAPAPALPTPPAPTPPETPQPPVEPTPPTPPAAS